VKIVLDTNVLIAAFYKPSHRPCFSREVYDYAIENATVYASAYVFREFHEKCVKKLGFKPGFVRHLESLIKKKVRMEPIKPLRSFFPEKLRVRDVKDHPIIELALSAGADVLLTWDKALLDLRRVGPVRVLSPREFWQSLQ
jgi:putative PIN family toxin of toxin-antitoxin system